MTRLTSWPKWVIDAHPRRYLDDLLAAALKEDVVRVRIENRFAAGLNADGTKRDKDDPYGLGTGTANQPSAEDVAAAAERYPMAGSEALRELLGGRAN